MNRKLSDRKVRVLYIICLALMVFMIVQGVAFTGAWKVVRLPPESIRDICFDMTGVFICGVLAFSLIHDKPLDAQNRALFRLIFTLCALLHFDSLSALFDGNPKMITVSVVSGTLLFAFETLLVYGFWVYVREELHIEKKSIPVVNILCKATLAAGFLLVLINLKEGFLFRIDGTGKYIYGSHEDINEIPAFVIYIVIWYEVLRAKNHSLREKAVLLSFQILHIIAHGLSFFFDMTANIYPTYLFSLMLIYINVFSVRGKKILEQQKALDEQRTRLMISQIQPHFLYNVLTTISNLCVTDPEEAEETTVLFSQYLRTNLDSLRQSGPVPFQAELRHIRTYIELEKKRFGDRIIEEIDCPETGFMVPALGLQPIVENSIKHGIRGKDTPGHLRITSRKTEGGYTVVIEDDGVGFDMNAPLPDDGRSHVGMANVRSRLEQICHAQVTVESSPGNGCRTNVFFPE